MHPGRLTAGTYSHHPFRKENDLPNLHEEMLHVNLPGCTIKRPTDGIQMLEIGYTKTWVKKLQGIQNPFIIGD